MKRISKKSFWIKFYIWGYSKKLPKTTCEYYGGIAVSVLWTFIVTYLLYLVGKSWYVIGWRGGYDSSKVEAIYPHGWFAYYIVWVLSIIFAVGGVYSSINSYVAENKYKWCKPIEIVD